MRPPRRLKLDHSTVCRRIGRLESLLAVKLFDRTRKGIAVRHEAQGLLKHIEQMDLHASSLEDALREAAPTHPGGARRHDGGHRERLSGAAPASACRNSAPNVKIELVSIPQTVDLTQGSRHLPELLQSGRARAQERAVRQFLAVSLLLARTICGGTARRRTATISIDMSSSAISTTCWPSMRFAGSTRSSTRADDELSQQQHFRAMQCRGFRAWHRAAADFRRRRASRACSASCRTKSRCSGTSGSRFAPSKVTCRGLRR